MADFLEMLVGGTAAGVGFVLGVGGTLAGARRIRPLARQAIKSYLLASERAREAVAEMAETMEDLYAEARAEHQAETRAAPVGERVSSG